MYIYHIFFIHLSVGGHIGCFHVLALLHSSTIVNSAAMNMGCIYLFELQFSPDICPRVGLLDYIAALFLVF